MTSRSLLLALAAAAAFTLPGCVFSVGGGHRHPPPPPTGATPHLSAADREQIALAEAYAAQSFPDDQRKGLVKLAARGDLTPAARLRIVEIARAMSFPDDRQAVLDALADHPTPEPPATPEPATPRGEPI